MWHGYFVISYVYIPEFHLFFCLYIDIMIMSYRVSQMFTKSILDIINNNGLTLYYFPISRYKASFTQLYIFSISIVLSSKPKLIRHRIFK